MVPQRAHESSDRYRGEREKTDVLKALKDAQRVLNSKHARVLERWKVEAF